MLELYFLENKSELLTEDESKAVGCLQSFFDENLVEQFQDILPSLEERSKLYLNFLIAHNILSPLTDECMLNERYRDYLGLGCAKSCKLCAKLEVPSTRDDIKFSGLGMGQYLQIVYYFHIECMCTYSNCTQQAFKM